FARDGFTNLFDTFRPMYAVWLGDNWRASDRLTLNLGLRWDADPSMAAPPGVVPNSIPISNGVLSGDFGYKTDIRDWKDFAPRAGFTYNVAGKNDLVIRGGSGIYDASPVSNVTYSPKVYSQLITATFANDGRANFITNPTNGVAADQIFSGAVRTPVQSPRVIVGDYSRSRSTPSPASTSTSRITTRTATRARSIRTCSSIQPPATTRIRRPDGRTRRTARC
ncbi:MAG: hypothetical protein DMG01_20905, partial [Acidobacteria bacterium]